MLVYLYEGEFKIDLPACFEISECIVTLLFAMLRRCIGAEPCLRVTVEGLNDFELIDFLLLFGDFLLGPLETFGSLGAGKSVYFDYVYTCVTV